MIFEREKYYNYINKLEKSITIAYGIIMLFAIIIGIATGIATLIITIPLGMIISASYTFGAKVKVQEMKWKFDIYEKIAKKEVA